MRATVAPLSMAALAIIILGAKPMPTDTALRLPAFDPAALVQTFDIGSDRGFSSLMQAQQKVDFHTAPADLRRLLANFEIPRLEMVQGFAHHKNRGELTWWMSEIGLVGEAETLHAQLANALKKMGFELQGDSGDGRWKAERRWENGTSEQLRFEGPHPWTGGRRRACGISLAWRIVDGRDSLPPTLEALLRTYPPLAHPELPKAFLAELAKAPVLELSLGGTWSEYYRWSLTLAPEAQDPSGASRHAQITRLIQGRKFAQLKKATGCGAVEIDLFPAR